MKKGLLIAALALFGATATFAQNAPAAATEKTVKTTKAKKGKKSKKAATETAKVMYECPMKCEPASDKAGKCGKCGMDLKAKKA
jgi:Heavy metal binding domain